MTKEEIVLETIEYYKTHNRGLTEFDGCTYLNDEGDMCAVGRCMTKEYREMYKNNTDYGVRTLDKDHGIDNILQEKYRGHPLEFWRYLQSLHDINDHWEGNNLTRGGKDYVKERFNIEL